MLDFNDNTYCLDDFTKKTFIELDVKNRYEVNKWLFINEKKVKDINGEYIILECFDNKVEKEYDIDWYDMDLVDFVKKYKIAISKIYEDGLYIKLILANEYNEDIYEGILKLRDNNIFIKDKYDSLIHIRNKFIIKNFIILKMVSKIPNLISVKDFLVSLENNNLLNNTLISLYLYQGHPLFIKNSPDGIKISKSSSFNNNIEKTEYENLLIKEFKFHYI